MIELRYFINKDNVRVLQYRNIYNLQPDGRSASGGYSGGYTATPWQTVQEVREPQNGR